MFVKNVLIVNYLFLLRLTKCSQIIFINHQQQNHFREHFEKAAEPILKNLI